MKKHKVITVAGFAISIILLYFSLRDIKFQEIAETLKKADPRFVLMPVVFVFISVGLSAFKWAKISGSNVKVVETFTALIIGLFVNNVLPARIGEIAKGYAISKKSGVSFTYAISTVLVDRFFDLVGLLLLTFLFLPKHSLPLRISQGIHILVALLIICMVVMIILSKERFIRILTDRASRMKKPIFLRLTRRIIEVQVNLKRINSPLNILRFIFIAFLQWLSMSSALFFTLLTLDISIPPVYVPFICSLLNMGLTIPSSPGYVGIYHFLLVYLLSIFGIPKYEGFTASILFHASWYIPYNILGFIFLLKEHLKIKEFKELNGADS